MKTNDSFKGGNRKRSIMQPMPDRAVKYIQAHKAEGIPIDAITPENEQMPGGSNPSMVMRATEQSTFIKNNLRPAFAAAGINTEIISLRSQCRPARLSPGCFERCSSKTYVNGSAFHLYGGSITALAGA